MNLCRRLRAASIFATLFCFCMQPAAAQQEIKLTKSITMLPDRPSGIEMIFKVWHNEHHAVDWFTLTFLATADRRWSGKYPGKYYKHVLASASGEPIEFLIWDNTGGCSENQTMVFRVPSQRGPRLVVGTAKRTLLWKEGDDPEDFPTKADLAPQRIRIYVPKTSEPDDFDKSPIWLDAIAETVTQKRVCSDEDVRKEIRLFLSQHIAELASQ